jgi:hypothetical protein
VERQGQDLGTILGRGLTDYTGFLEWLLGIVHGIR